MIRGLFVVALLAGVSAPAFAQDCAKPAGWDKPARHAAARLPRFRFGLQPGQSAELGLLVQRSVVLATKEGREGWMDRYAGLAALDVDRPGKLDIVLSSRAYVDLVKDGTTLQSIEHDRVRCPGMFKRVTFEVQPGRHVIQITGSQARSIRIGLVPR
jgi:hypothetical protein